MFNCRFQKNEWSFTLRVSSVSITKSTYPFRFGHVYWQILKRTSFSVQGLAHVSMSLARQSSDKDSVSCTGELFGLKIALTITLRNCCVNVLKHMWASCTHITNPNPNTKFPYPVYSLMFPECLYIYIPKQRQIVHNFTLLRFKHQQRNFS